MEASFYYVPLGSLPWNALGVCTSKTVDLKLEWWTAWCISFIFTLEQGRTQKQVQESRSEHRNSLKRRRPNIARKLFKSQRLAARQAFNVG